MDIDFSQIVNRRYTISKSFGRGGMGDVYRATKQFKSAPVAFIFLLAWVFFGIELIGHTAYANEQPASQANLTETSKSKPIVDDVATADVVNAVKASEPAKAKTVTKPQTKPKTPEPRITVSVDDIVAAFECSRDPTKCGNQNGSPKPQIASKPRASSSVVSSESAVRLPVAQSLAQHGYDFDVSETTHTKIE